jgi:hypothetical protein
MSNIKITSNKKTQSNHYLILCQSVHKSNMLTPEEINTVSVWTSY